MRRSVVLLGVGALVVSACTSHSSEARRQAHMACTALIKNVGPISSDVPYAADHLRMAAAIDHARFGAISQAADALQREFAAARTGGWRADLSKPTLDLESRCQPFL